DRVKKARLPGKIVVAAPKGQRDKPLEKIAKSAGAGFFQGSGENVLKRFIDCAEENGFGTIVRVCADSPLVSPLFLDKAVKQHVKSGNDYTDAFSTLPFGMGCEVVSLSALKRVLKATKRKRHLEHVTLYIKENRKLFKAGCLKTAKNFSLPGVNLTIDYEHDLIKIKNMLAALNKQVQSVSVKDVFNFFTLKPGKPLVSIIIVTRNYGRFIEKSLASVLNQTMPKNQFDVVVVDDGSTDNTPRILKKYGKMLRVFRKKAEGSIIASNFAFKRARGKFVTKLDADDWFEPEALEKMFKALEKNKKAAFAYCDIRHLIGKKQRTVSLRKFGLFKTIACGILFRKKEIIELNGAKKMYNEKLFFPEYDL
ncbi:MAG: glycosyltransferase, partial [Candidatus Diapherotrites archaeon]|nr:glycosyltransferase [Candidatus Diapherotrites archaeon]